MFAGEQRKLKLIKVRSTGGYFFKSQPNLLEKNFAIFSLWLCASISKGM